MRIPLVLAICNHHDAKQYSPAAGVFVDRQISSLRDLGARIIQFDIGSSHSPVQIISKLIELRRKVHLEQPDVVHAQYGTIVSLLGAFTGRPLVISFCGNDLLDGASVSSARMYIGFLMSNIAALRAKQIICKSSELSDALWWRRCNVVVIPNGVDLALFSPGSREVARKVLGWDADRLVVLLNVGSDPVRKGLDLANLAIDLVRAKLTNVELRVISHIEPHIMPLLYQAADALLCASIREGSPNVVKEALACNLPIVSTPVGDVPERLLGVHPSEIVTRDAKAIAEALVRILSKRERSNGRDRVASLDQGLVAKRILKVYQSACNSMFNGSTSEELVPNSHRSKKKVRVVTIRDEDLIRQVAQVHLQAFEGYLNVLLGAEYIQSLIRWFARRDDGIALAIVDVNQRVLGYAFGAPSGYAKQLNRDLKWILLKSMVVRPWLFFNARIWHVIVARLRLLLITSSVEKFQESIPVPTMSLVGFGVISEVRREGIGSNLMDEFCCQAEKLKMNSATLTVYKHKTSARLFYEKCGWQPFDQENCGRESSKTLKYYRILGRK